MPRYGDLHLLKQNIVDWYDAIGESTNPIDNLKRHLLLNVLDYIGETPTLDLSELDKIAKVNYYLTRKYKEEIFKEFGITVDEKNDNMFLKIMKAFDAMYELMSKEMPLMWYEYGFNRSGNDAEEQ